MNCLIASALLLAFTGRLALPVLTAPALQFYERAQTLAASLKCREVSFISVKGKNAKFTVLMRIYSADC